MLITSAYIAKVLFSYKAVEIFIISGGTVAKLCPEFKFILLKIKDNLLGARGLTYKTFYSMCYLWKSIMSLYTPNLC